MEFVARNFLASGTGLVFGLSGARAGLVVTEVEGPPTGKTVRISQLERDETGPTSFRFYAARSDEPTKIDEWVYKMRDGKPDGTEAKFFYRDRDLGQVFKTGKEGFRLGAITVRLQPVNVEDGDPTGGKVSVQIFKVTGEPRVNDNGTTETEAPNGTSTWEKGGPMKGKTFTNPQWSTYASDWPEDPAAKDYRLRWPVMFYSDDFLEGETYESIAVARGGVVPAKLDKNDYLRWEFSEEDRLALKPETRYAFLFMFDERVPEGVKRNIPLSNQNLLPGGKMADVYPEGHAIRRDGSSRVREEVFIYDVENAEDVATARRAVSFPEDFEERVNLPVGTLGYPDVDTYRDLWFVTEAAE